MRVPKPSTVRRRGETRLKNFLYTKSVQEAKNRQTLRQEQAQLHNLLYQTINPTLRDRVRDRAQVVGKMLGD